MRKERHLAGAVLLAAGAATPGMAGGQQPAALARGVAGAQQMPRTPTAIPPALYQGMRWRLVGPYRAGWATIGIGVPGAPNTFYFGSAGGGVWKSTDAGQTWRPLMQNASGAAIGALAGAPSDPNVLYAGTGQVAARYDIMAGDGVYRSSDAGAHWTHTGLDATRHIGALLVDPRNPNRVLAGALGHVFGPSHERGVYVTADGGRTWRQTLFVSDSTGVVDLAWDPTQPGTVYAAAWQMRMHPWLDYFQPYAGRESGIYRSTDGGEHWTRLTGSALPAGAVGRIGLAVARGSGGRIVYAAIDVPGGTTEGGVYRSDDAGATWTRVSGDHALASSYFSRLTVAPNDPNRVYVMGRSISLSTDGGRHFEFVKGAPGGDDYHELWISPENPSHMITGSDQGAAVSVDGGATWSSWYNQPTGQFYHLAADDRFPYHVYSGQQDNGTVEIASRGPYGVIEERDWHPVGGDERDYMVPKPGNPTIVFGSGLGGHVSRYDDITRQVAEVSPWPVTTYGARPTTVKYRYTWITPLVFSPVGQHALYLGSQVLWRSTDDGDHWATISPDLSGKTGTTSGAPCETPDRTAARACGFGVIYTIAPSPLEENTIWIGTDDGLIQTTSDGGAHWRNGTPPAIPMWGRIDAIAPSPFDARSAYAAVDLHRLDRFTPMLLRTTDGGAHWTSITTGIPADEYTTVIRADSARRGLLYAGTNRGVYVSFDDGASWQPLSLNLPTTWVRDLLVHRNDLVVATQGHAIWILDDLAPLHEATPAIAAGPAHLFRPAPAWRLRPSENRDTPWPAETPLGQNPPTGAVLDYALGSATRGPVMLTIRDSTGRVVRRFASDERADSLPADRYFQREWTREPERLGTAPGMHRVVWDLRYPRPAALSYEYSIAAVWDEDTPLDPRGALVAPGHYTATLTANGREYTQPVEVRLDPRIHATPAALQRQVELAQAIDTALGRAVMAHREIEQTLSARKGTLPSATAASLDTLADRGNPSFGRVANVLASLVTAVQSADVAPTAGERAVFDQYRQDLDALLTRWQRLRQMVPGATPGGSFDR